jgi:hypothetical protein
MRKCLVVQPMRKLNWPPKIETTSWKNPSTWMETTLIVVVLMCNQPTIEDIKLKQVVYWIFCLCPPK